MDKYRVGIIMPALNESTTIAGLVQAVWQYGVPIVVDDGSMDSTAELARRASAIVVSHSKSQGYDSAINTGFKKAEELGMEVVVTLDADGQHNPRFIEAFVDSLDAGADIVVGIRSSRQRFAEGLFAFYTRLRYDLKDPLCGMKAYRMTLYRAVGHFDSYRSIGTELALFALKNRYKLQQVKFDVGVRLGPSKFGTRISANYKIIRAMLLSIIR